jgi:hypothetical protein
MWIGMLEGWMDGMKGTGDEAMWEEEEEWNGVGMIGIGIRRKPTIWFY